MNSIIKLVYLSIASLVGISFYSCSVKPETSVAIKIYSTNCDTIKTEQINPESLIAKGEMVSTQNNHQLLEQQKTHWLYIETEDVNQSQVLSFGKNISVAEVYPYPFYSIESSGGLMVAANKKIFPGSDLLIDFEAPAYLIKVQNSVHSKIFADEITLIPLLKYQASIRNKGLLQGFVQGCLWLMIVFNLILFIANKKRIHIYYVLFVFCNSLYLLYSFGYSELYIFSHSAPLNQMFLSFQLLGLIFYSLFLRVVFLEHCPVFNKKIDKIIIIPYCYFLGVITLVMAIATYVNMTFFVRWIAVVNIVSGILAAGCFVCYFKNSSIFARHIAIGSLLMIVGGYITVTTDMFYQPSNIFPYQFGLLLELIIFSYALNQLHISETKKRHLSEIAQLKLQNELSERNRELVQKAMQLTTQSEVLARVKHVIEENGNGNDSIKSIYNQLQTSNSENLWKEFEMHFNKTHPEFYSSLLRQFPTLTNNELKLCAFLKMNLSTKEIAAITQKSVHSIEAMRSRIRKKMNLCREGSLLIALSELENGMAVYS